MTKDLSVIAEDLNVPVQDVYLIDDSPHKRIGNQNFIQIAEYNGSNQKDEDLIRIIKEIYKLLGLTYEEKMI